MQFAIINKSIHGGGSDYFREINLRETKSFYIDDETGVKYKKAESADSWFLASKFNNSSHRYSRSTDYIVDLNGEKCNAIREKLRNTPYINAVQKEAREIVALCSTLETAKKLASQLGLEIEL